MNEHRRRSIRLNSYDYTTDGAYFVTVCVHQRECLFGGVVGGVVKLSAVGEVVREEWLKTEEIRPNIELDAFVVMPNHLHGILLFHSSPTITDKRVTGRGAQLCAPTQGTPTLYRPPRSLGSLIAGFKSAVTKRINLLRDTPGAPVWQRNYYEHIIRSEQELNSTRAYIENNPALWIEDTENPANVKLKE